ncbi:MAG: ASKHA domain-containing protein [Deltaproteobacteria bacterium]|nr:ASKHA domain-containing protein [Deltaproteobacteria bacterium]
MDDKPAIQSPKEVRVTFLPLGREVRVSQKTSLLNAALDAGVPVDSVCGGKGVCGKCRGRILEGDPGAVSSAEKRFLDQKELKEGMVLLCQRSVSADLVVETAMGETSGAFSPSKGAVVEMDMEVDPQFVKTRLELTPPTLTDQRSDLDGILSLLPDHVRPDPRILNSLPHLLRKSNYRVTSVEVNGHLISVEEGDTEKQCYGIAFDVGTTTVGGYLVDLKAGTVLASASSGNRQARYGADVISRITHIRNAPDALSHMKSLVIETIEAIIANLLATSGVDSQNVYLMSVVGNTVMSHFLLGISADNIASAPFVPVFSRLPALSVDHLGLRSLKPETRLFLLPNIAGYVGADTTGMILATHIHEGEQTRLAMDIGTNGEIVLASKGRFMACSTAAGPAFEGGSISQGMRAEPGAVCAVRLNGDVHLKTVGDQTPRGICGSGLVDAVSEMVRLGIINRRGRIEAPVDCPDSVPLLIKNRIRQHETGNRFLLFTKNQEIAVTQKDISELQLAKGALRAGIEILMEAQGLSAEDLDEILLAGAFGSGLRPESLMGIGLLPNIPLDRVKAVGNAAGKGAVMALLSKRKKALAATVAKTCEHVELSAHKDFFEKFARALAFC